MTVLDQMSGDRLDVAVVLAVRVAWESSRPICPDVRPWETMTPRERRRVIEAGRSAFFEDQHPRDLWPLMRWPEAEHDPQMTWDAISATHRTRIMVFAEVLRQIHDRFVDAERLLAGFEDAENEPLLPGTRQT